MVQMMTGTTFSIAASMSETINDFKCRIEDARGFPKEQQDLVFGVVPLEGNLKLSDYNVRGGSTLSILIRPPQQVVEALMEARKMINFEERSTEFYHATAAEQGAHLLQIGEILARHTYLNLLIEGHAGPDPHIAPRLSQMRAIRCAQGIVGVSKKRIHVRGLGCGFLVDPRDVTENRRVEFYVLTPDRRIYPKRDHTLTPLPAVEDAFFPAEDTQVILLPRSIVAVIGRYQTTQRVNVRKGEALDSDFLGYLPVHTILDILRTGKDVRRALISVNALEGWVSLRKATGEPLLERLTDNASLGRSHMI